MTTRCFIQRGFQVAALVGTAIVGVSCQQGLSTGAAALPDATGPMVLFNGRYTVNADMTCQLSYALALRKARATLALNAADINTLQPLLSALDAQFTDGTQPSWSPTQLLQSSLLAASIAQDDAGLTAVRAQLGATLDVILELSVERELTLAATDSVTASVASQMDGGALDAAGADVIADAGSCFASGSWGSAAQHWDAAAFYFNELRPSVSLVQSASADHLWCVQSCPVADDDIVATTVDSLAIGQGAISSTALEPVVEHAARLEVYLTKVFLLATASRASAIQDAAASSTTDAADVTLGAILVEGVLLPLSGPISSPAATNARAQWTGSVGALTARGCLQAMAAAYEDVAQQVAAQFAGALSGNGVSDAIARVQGVVDAMDQILQTSGMNPMRPRTQLEVAQMAFDAGELAQAQNIVNAVVAAIVSLPIPSTP